jgi:hypothetical protein
VEDDSGKREASAILTTRSLARSTAFYARLTGRDIPVHAGTAEITPGLLLHQSAADTLIDASSVIVNIAVDNLQAASGRLGLDTTTNDHTAMIEVRDPDGRTVRISQHPVRTRMRSGPAVAVNLTLEPGVLVEATVELLRTEDDIPLRRLLNHVVPDARSLYRAGDEQAMDHLLDQLTRLAATFLDLDRLTWLHRTGDSLVAIYNIAFEGEAEIINRPSQQAALHWLKIIERVEATGALAIRREAWAAVRDLASRKPDGMHHMYASWLRHATTMANRGGIVPTNGRADAGVSMISRARDTIRRLAELRSDLQTDDDRILTSLNQFDFLACVVAQAMTHNGGSGGAYYPHFARFHGSRTQPIAERLLADAALRRQMYPGTNRQLVEALHQIDETARKMGFAYDGWEGYTAPVVEFVRANLSA